MPQCAFKNCESSHRNTKVSEGISFFRFPSDPFCYAEWISIVAKEREEELYRPYKNSTICSIHFDKSDITGNSQRRRLLKTAIPKLQIHVKQQKVQAAVESTTSNLVASITNLEDPTAKYDMSQADSTCSSSPAASISDLIPIYDSPRIRYLKKKLTTCKIIDTCKKRLKKKNCSLKNICNLLQKKKTIDDSIFLDLSKNVEVAEVFNESYIKNKKNRTRPFTKYPPGVRKFALTLHFYSPSAYKYVRKMFNTCLPHPHTLYDLYRSVNAEPGFCSETLNRLEEKAKSNDKIIMCALVADEMSIKRQKIWTGKRYEGVVDMGLGLSDDSSPMATQAYVFMLVAINDSWKLPLAYFFIDSIKADMKANLIKIALEKCSKIGVQIRSVTFDGCKSNIATMTNLGCKLDDFENLKTNFKHPCANYDVVVLLDACHMVKLMRNTFESKKYIYTADEKMIKWKYVTDLYNLHEEQSLHLANKLSHRHVYLKNQIMNVKLASQLLSRSVAAALKFSEKTLNIPAFQNSESTIEFIHKLNDIFDVLNTSNLKDFGFKSPLNKNNSQKIIHFLSESKDYLLSLTIDVKYKKTVKVGSEARTVFTNRKVPLIRARNNTGLLGLLVCINSLIYLYENLIATDILKFLLTYKLSQDHVELFFSSIRSLGGHNNNPNTRQFKASFKKLLSHLELSSKFTGNCLSIENILISPGLSPLRQINSFSTGYRYDATQTKNLSTAEIKKSQSIQQSFDKYQTNCNELSEKLDRNPISDVSSQMVGYISGFVVSSLVKNLNCDDCKKDMWATEKLWFHKLIDIRDMGGLCYASNDVFDICMNTERVIRNCFRISGGKAMQKKYDKNFIRMVVSKSFIENIPFAGKPEHTHKINLLTLIIEKYIDVRLHYICIKETSQAKDCSKRQLYNKLILFKSN